MTENSQNERLNWGISLGFGALMGVLISAIVGMLRLSKPTEQTNTPKPGADQDAAAALPPGTSLNPAPKPEGPSATQVEPPTTQWSRGTKFFVAGLLFLALLGILYISSSSLSTIIFAALLTFIVQPLVNFFQRRFRMRRGGATLLTYLIVLGLILLIPVLIIPNIVEAIQFVAGIDYLSLLADISNWLQLQAQIVASIPLVGASLASSLAELAKILENIAAENPQAASEIDLNFQDIGGRISQTLNFLVGIFGPLISIGTTVVFTLLISLHMSLSVDMLKDGIKKLIPPAYKTEITQLIRQTIIIWQSFLRGQLSLMVIMGVLVWFGNTLLGTPQALILGILAGLLEVIPSLGPILATIPAVIFALLFGSQTSLLGLNTLDSWIFALIVIGFYVIIQVIENQLLVPYVLGDAVDLPPLIVIVGVVIGGSAFGLLGVFLATPVISSGREIFMYLYDKILEPPPEPEPPEEKPSLLETLRGYAARLPRPKLRRTLPAEPAAALADEQVTN